MYSTGLAPDETVIRFTIDGPQIKDLEVVELALRGKIT